ncbi:MAG: aminoglycoside phosphotransferase family protein [Alphaproteobacteria bacterium]|nr:aminoglycoside phosphotransferase family protein [Alphaproteobacteria bacterium]
MPIHRPDIETAKKILADAYKSGLIPFDAKTIEPYCEGGGALTLKCIDTDRTEYVVRFPNTENKLNNMLQEIDTLQFLDAQNLSVKGGIKIPQPHYVTHDTYPFVWHQALVGQTLLPHSYHELNEKQKSDLAKKIAIFMHAMHTCKLPNISGKTPTDFIMAQMKLRDLDILGPKIPAPILQKYKTLKLNTNYPETLCHFDMHGRNMALDPKTKDLVGIFDFGDTSIRSCFLDFYKLSFIHRDLTRRVIDIYNKISNIKIDIHDVDLAYLCTIARQYEHSPNDGILNKSLENFVQDVTSAQIQNAQSHKI